MVRRLAPSPRRTAHSLFSSPLRSPLPVRRLTQSGTSDRWPAQTVNIALKPSLSYVTYGTMPVTLSTDGKTVKLVSRFARPKTR
jgi:hypothetical protein